MTRQDLLAARANDVVEACLAREVCLSEGECAIVREQVQKALFQVEQECWEVVLRHCSSLVAVREKLMPSLPYVMQETSKIRNEELGGMAEWCRAQQKELE